MSTTAWLSGASAANVDRGTDYVAWSSPTNALSDNGSNASATFSWGDSQTSTDALAVYNFTTGIPDGATIDGVEINVEGCVVGTAEAGQFAAYLAKDASTGLADATLFGTVTAPTDTTADMAFGSSSTLVAGWSNSDYLTSTFGVVVVAVAGNSNTTGARVDHVEVRITYTEASGAQVMIWGM